MSDFKFDPKKLEEVKANLSEAIKKFEQVRADYGAAEPCEMSDMMNHYCCMVDSLSYTLQSLQRQVSYISDSFYNHVSQGHLPPAPGPAAMASAIDALGWSKDFEVNPRQIYAALEDGFIKVNGRKIN